MDTCYQEAIVLKSSPPAQVESLAQIWDNESRRRRLERARQDHSKSGGDGSAAPAFYPQTNSPVPPPDDRILSSTDAIPATRFFSLAISPAPRVAGPTITSAGSLFTGQEHSIARLHLPDTSQQPYPALGLPPASPRPVKPPRVARFHGRLPCLPRLSTGIPDRPFKTEPCAEHIPLRATVNSATLARTCRNFTPSLADPSTTVPTAPPPSSTPGLAGLATLEHPS